jgi:hypothetical protein
VTRGRAALAVLAAVAVGVALVSGGSDAGPRTPAALPGLPPPFLGTAVSGDGGLTAAIDAYGDVVELLAPGPAGRALVDNPSARQAAGTVPAETGIVPRVSIDGGPARALWEADAVAQRFLPGTNVVVTTARFGPARVAVEAAATAEALAVRMRVRPSTGAKATPSFSVNVSGELRCAREGHPGQLDLLCRVGRAASGVSGVAAEDGQALIGRSAREDRRWIAGARPLGAGAPAWATAMYERSLLTLHALTDSRTGAVAAGARDGWAYLWPRDAATAALAYEAAGYADEARRVTRFLTGLDLGVAARFDGSGNAVPGRGPQGDESGWVAVAAQATGLPVPPPLPWRDRPDYQEGSAGDYLGNAVSAGVRTLALEDFRTRRGLVRRAGDPSSGLDSAAAWLVRPFRVAALEPAAWRTLLHLIRHRTPFGITPGEGWSGGTDPWSAPTAWSAWAFAALSRESATRGKDRRRALALLGDLRRAATPAGELPERVDAHSGVARSTTPLAWPHAFAVLALRELWL